MAKNDDVLNDFIESAGLVKDGLGRAHFDATVTIRAQGNGGMEDTKVTASHASGDMNQIVIDETGDLVAGKVKLDYTTASDTWTTAGNTLTISGKYKSKTFETTIKKI